jgi:hypothetical protein
MDIRKLSTEKTLRISKLALAVLEDCRHHEFLNTRFISAKAPTPIRHAYCVRRMYYRKWNDSTAGRQRGPPLSLHTSRRLHCIEHYLTEAGRNPSDRATNLFVNVWPGGRCYDLSYKIGKPSSSPVSSTPARAKFPLPIVGTSAPSSFISMSMPRSNSFVTRNWEHRYPILPPDTRIFSLLPSLYAPIHKGLTNVESSI